jgi:uncharacterized iron-regulated membrane protein
MKPRTFLFWIHLALGGATLLFIFIMSATGVLLTYQRQILEWYDTHDYRLAPPTPGAPHLRPDQIVAAARAARPDAPISSIAFHADPFAPAEVGIGRRTLFLNPYSGHVWGERTDGPRPFFRVISAWHTGLGSGPDGIGHTIAAASNLAVVFMIVSGFILWFPRSLSWKAVRSVLWFRRGLRGRGRDFNWHQVLGFWCALPLLVVVLGALPMSYSWASDLVFRVVGETPEPRRGSVRAAAQNGGEVQRSVTGGRGQKGTAAVDMERVTELWARAEQHGPDWQMIRAQLPTASDAPLEFTIERGTSQQPQKRSVLSIDMETGGVVGLVTFGDRSLGARLRTYLRFAHTGEVLAFTSQTIAAIAAAAACMMSWTGLALLWRRFSGKPARRPRAPDVSVT